MASKEDTLKIVMVMAAFYPAVKLRDETIDGYCMMLADVDRDILQAAVKKCISDCKWFPTIAEIRQAAVEICAPARRSGAEAWGDVLAEVRRVGYRGAPKFIDTAVARVVSGMGWMTICMSENEMADRAHFIKAYEQTQTRDADDMRQLPEVRELALRLQVGSQRLLSGRK